jgi:MFS family permease
MGLDWIIFSAKDKSRQVLHRGKAKPYMDTEAPQSERIEIERDPAYVFGAASFLNDTGSDMIAPIWPTFLEGMGFTQGHVQIIDGLALTVTSIAKLGAGYASDRMGRRKFFITLGYGLSMVSRLGFLLVTYFAYKFEHLAFWKSMDRLGKMRGPPRDAIVADQAAEKKRGRAFGVLRSLDTAGAVLGTAITFFLFQFLGYGGIILLAAIPSAGSVIIVSVLVKERRGRDVFKGVSFRGLNRNLKLFLVASILFALATYSYSLLIFLSEAQSSTVQQQTMLYLLFTIVYAASAYPFGRLSDRVGRKPILVIAFLLLILTSLWFYSVIDLWTIAPMFLFFGLMNGALDPVQTSLVADLVDRERRASIIGAFQMAIGIAALPGGILIGYLWDMSPSLAFQYSIALTVVALVLLLLIRTTSVEEKSGPGEI